jgi:hypothetical protein
MRCGAPAQEPRLIALAALLLGHLATARLPTQGAGSAGGLQYVVRSVPAQFEQFDNEVLCALVSEASAPSGPLRLVVQDDPQIRVRHRSCSLGAIRRELADWVSALAPLQCTVAERRHMEARVTAALLARSDVQCAYFLAPLALPKAHPIVVVRHEVIEAVGRQQFLHALWQSEVCAGKAGADGLDRDVGALYDSLLRRGSAPRP